MFFWWVEGAFFPAGVWLKLVGIIMKFYDGNYFNGITNHWPVEEVLTPTLLKSFACEPSCTNLVYTKK